MGGHMSKKFHNNGASSSANYTTELSAYEAACEADSDLRSFDTALQARTSHVINSLAVGVEVRALSFESLKEVTECLLEMNQEVVRVILQCKKDIWRSQELFDLVEDYFETSLQTLDFCAALENCLKRAKDAHLLVLVALRHFDAADPARALAELRSLPGSGEIFSPEFFSQFSGVYRHQAAMLEKLAVRKRRLDQRSRAAHAWRKVSSVIFVAAFAAVLICSVVAAAMAAPPVAAALAAATSIPIGSVGKWIDSLWRKYEDALKGQKEVVSSMQVGSYVAVKDLENIRVLVDRLEVEIEAVLDGAGFVGEEGGVRAAVEEIRRRLGGFMRNVEELGAQADGCGRDIRRARTVVLQRIIKNPNSH